MLRRSGGVFFAFPLAHDLATACDVLGVDVADVVAAAADDLVRYAVRGVDQVVAGAEVHHDTGRVLDAQDRDPVIAAPEAVARLCPRIVGRPPVVLAVAHADYGAPSLVAGGAEASGLVTGPSSGRRGREHHEECE